MKRLCVRNWSNERLIKVRDRGEIWYSTLVMLLIVFPVVYCLSLWLGHLITIIVFITTPVLENGVLGSLVAIAEILAVCVIWLGLLGLISLGIERLMDVPLKSLQRRVKQELIRRKYAL